jgi:hypothetical protein
VSDTRYGGEKKEGGKNREKGKKKGKINANREELWQQGHERSRKTTCCERGKNVIFRRGGWNKYHFWTEI